MAALFTAYPDTMTFHYRSLFAVALTLVAGAAIAATPGKTTSQPSASKADTSPLVWRGDTTTADGFVDGMASAWHKAGHPRITLQPFNTVSGIDAVAHGTADIAGSVRGRAPRRGDESSLVFTPVAWDALAIITNPHNPVDSLTLKQVHDIYYGKITNWSEVGGKDKPINVYAVASPTDGIEFSLRRLLFGRGNQPVAAPRLYLTVTALQKAVALDPQSLAVSTLSNAYDKPKLKMLAINGKKPSVANVADGSYPLYTPLYLVTRPAPTDANATRDQPRSQRISQFLMFAQSPEVAAIMHKHHLVPYADAQALAGHDAARIAAIAKQTGRHVYHHNGPTAAPGATYASRVATAPTSERTQAARKHMLARRDEENAANVRAQAQQARHVVVPEPEAAGGKPQVTWYTVSKGDTLSKIARTKSVTVDQLRDWNNIDGNLIHVGQRLAIHHE